MQCCVSNETKRKTGEVLAANINADMDRLLVVTIRAECSSSGVIDFYFFFPNSVRFNCAFSKNEFICLIHWMHLSSAVSGHHLNAAYKRCDRAMSRVLCRPHRHEIWVEAVEGREKAEMNESGERDGQRGKDNEVKAIVIKPIRKMDTEVGGLAQ